MSLWKQRQFFYPAVTWFPGIISERYVAVFKEDWQTCYCLVIKGLALPPPECLGIID